MFVLVIPKRHRVARHHNEPIMLVSTSALGDDGNHGVGITFNLMTFPTISKETVWMRFELW